MKVHLSELFTQCATTFLTFIKWVITDFLQDFYNILTLFALILIYRHWSLLAVEAVTFRYFYFFIYYNPAY